MRIVAEGKALITVPDPTKISARLPIFYNPVMKTNRDITVLLLNSLSMQRMHIGLPLAATGIRGIRFLKELKRGKIASISMNDHNPKFEKIVSENFKLSKVRCKVSISNEDANLFLLNSTGFDYIDIDPFGSPNPFLDSAVKRLSRKSILALTATDTAALASFPAVCKRKYWATPLLTAERHEVGIRILIRKAQLIGAQFDKALVPIFSYFKDHYYRVFFACTKSKEKVDGIMKQHGTYKEAGPLWRGQLWDKTLVHKMHTQANDDIKEFLGIIKEESAITSVGFYDIHEFCKKHRKVIPPHELLLKKIRRKHVASRTHFTGTGIRSTISEKELLALL